MLILRPKRGESIIIVTPSGRITVRLMPYDRHGGLALGFDAPAECTVNRAEVQARIDARESLKRRTP